LGIGLLASGVVAALFADWLDYPLTAMPNTSANGLLSAPDAGSGRETDGLASPLRLLLAGLLGSLLAALATWLVLTNRQRRWQAEIEAEARKESSDEVLLRQRFEFILAGTNTGTWEWNVQTGETRFNERWAEIVGCTLAELEPTTIETWARLAHPVDLGASELLLTQHLAGESEYYDFKARMRHKDGRWVWVHDRGRVATWTPDGKPEWMFGSHLDITAERELARRLAESQDLLERGGDMARLGGWRFEVFAPEVDPASVPMAWTATTFRIYEVPEDFQPTAANSLNFYTDESRPIIASLAKRAIDTGEGWECDLQVRTWNGRVIWIRILGEAEWDDDGKVIALYGVVQDIDAQRRIEEDLRHAKAEADEANAAKSRFLANTSHEIRTPLNALIGLTYLLDKSDLKPDQRDLLSKIEFAGSSLAAVINDVLDLSKVESGEMTLEELPLNFGAMAAEVVAVMGSTAAQRGIELRCRLDPGLPPLVLGDITRLRQILTNLLSNALKFTERGGQVTVSLSSPGVVDGVARFRLSVMDNGIGIPEEALKRLFTPFTQADSSTTRTHGGTGLGLSIVQRLTEMMAGVVTVVSTPGVGSEFWVDLPLRVPGDDSGLVPRLSSDAIRVWVATPDDAERRALVALCRSLGWLTDQANSGEALVESLRTNATAGQLPHVLVMRWRMGDLDAATILHDARQAVGAHSLPAVVLLSNQEESFAEQQPYSALAVRVLRAPMDASQLFNAVSEAAASTVSAREGRESASDALRGLTIAVADDSELNLLVARRILELHGATVLAETGGRAVLDLLRVSGSSIDALLLDVQMPEIDGNEVARRIRSELGLMDLPIIALTADALITERDEAFASGMNAFLSKPFDPAVLVRTILDQVGSDPTAAAPPAGPSEFAAATPHHGTSDQWPQISGIDDPDAIMDILDGDAETFLQLLGGLLAEHDPDQMRATAKQAVAVDRDAVRRQLHKLRGSSAALGATTIAESAGELENGIRSGDLRADELNDGLLTLADRLDALRQGLAAARKTQAVLVTATKAAAAARTHQTSSLGPGQLEHFRLLLHDRDLAAESWLTEFGEQLRASIGDVDHAELQSAVCSLQFDRAAQIVDLHLVTQD
jgi:PAS domain S-box-containing protein